MSHRAWPIVSLSCFLSHLLYHFPCQSVRYSNNFIPPFPRELPPRALCSPAPTRFVLSRPVSRQEQISCHGQISQVLDAVSSSSGFTPSFCCSTSSCNFLRICMKIDIDTHIHTHTSCMFLIDIHMYIYIYIRNIHVKSFRVKYLYSTLITFFDNLAAYEKSVLKIIFPQNFESVAF